MAEEHNLAPGQFHPIGWGASAAYSLESQRNNPRFPGCFIAMPATWAGLHCKMILEHFLKLVPTEPQLRFSEILFDKGLSHRMYTSCSQHHIYGDGEVRPKENQLTKKDLDSMHFI